MALTDQAIADLKSRPRISVTVGLRSNQDIYNALITAGIRVDDFSKRALLESPDADEETEIEAGIFSGYDLGLDHPSYQTDVYFEAKDKCKFRLLDPPAIGELRLVVSQPRGKWFLTAMDALWNNEKCIAQIMAFENDFKGHILLRSAVGSVIRLWNPSVEWLFGIPRKRF